MSFNPLVSILIPAYNSERWIGAAISSALAQSWPKKEVIVVDDGSRDATRSVALMQECPQLRVITQENQGVSAARNAAYSLAQGEYIQWLDADDILDREKVEIQMRAVEESGNPRVLFSGEWGYFYHRIRHARFKPTALWHDLTPAEWMLRKMDQNLFMQTGTWLVSRELSDAAGPWTTGMQKDNDGEYFCRVIMKSNAIRFIPGAKVFYRRAGASSLSHLARSDSKLDAMFFSMRRHIECLLSLEDSERARAACVRYLQRLSVYFHPEREDLFAQADALARRYGGSLTVPPISWKYAWIRQLFGWKPARRAQFYFPRFKESIITSWDKALFHMEEWRL